MRVDGDGLYGEPGDDSYTGDPPGYKSKGWQVEAPLIVDHTNPVFDGIEVIYGAEINDYVGEVLIPELQSRGIVYTADNQTGDAAYLYTRYMELVGEAIDDDDVVLVVKGDDPLNAGSDQGSWLHDFMGIDFVNGNGQFGYIDEAWEDLFHVDEPPCASQERSSEYWPKCTAGNLWWDEGPPPDLHLHTDGYGHGEYSCWVAPIPCEWFDYQGAKLRIRDDVNNWTHSENLVSGEELGIDIVQPSGCGDTPEDRCDFACGSTVTFEAEITGLQYVESLEQSIDWYVLQDDGQGGWNELDKEHYPGDSGFQSIITQESWTGPSFTVLLDDLEFQLRAKVVVCGEAFYDDCFIKDEFEVLGLIFRETRYPHPNLPQWQDPCHWDFNSSDANHAPPPDRRDANHSPAGGFVINRPNNDSINLFLYAITEDQAPHNQVQVTLSARDDHYDDDLYGDDGYSIAVQLPRVSQQDLVDDVLADFDCGNAPPSPETRCVYGVDEGIPLYDEAPWFGSLYMIVSNTNDSPKGDVHDYSRMRSCDECTDTIGLALLVALGVVPSFHYGQLRGDFLSRDFYNAADRQENFRDNVLNMGQEVIRAKYDGGLWGLGSKEAFLPVQSMPDVVFFFTHTRTSTLQSDPPDGCDNQVVSLACWPDQPGGVWPPVEATDIAPADVAQACPDESDTEWIGLIGCSPLHINLLCTAGEDFEGFDDWKYIIDHGNSSITAVGGFREGITASFRLRNFGSRVSELLEDPAPYNADLWDPAIGDNLPPGNKFVVAWMQAAMRELRGYRDSAVAISHQGVWIIRDLGDDDEHDWRITLL